MPTQNDPLAWPADQAGNKAAFENCATTIAATPFFTQPPKRTNSPKHPPAGGNWAAFVANIAALLPGSTADDQRRVTNAILGSAHVVSVSSGSDIDNEAIATMFVQNAVAVRDTSVDNIYYCTVEMAYSDTHSNHSVSVSQSGSFDIEGIETGFDLAVWPNYTAAVAAKQVATVDRWLTKTTSPT